MGETPPDFSKLPSIAFTVLPATGETVAILRGESACYHIGSSKSADELNRLYGVTRAQALAMLAGATHGWATPFADPDNYDADGVFLSSKGG